MKLEGIHLPKIDPERPVTNDIDNKVMKKYMLNQNQGKFLTEYLKNGHKVKEAYRSAYGSKVGENEPTLMAKASRLMGSPKIKMALADQIRYDNKNRGFEVVTIDEVLDVLGSILKRDDAADKDKIKAGELLLKHLNAFQEHNSSRASKSISIMTSRTTEQLKEDIIKMQQQVLMIENNLISPSELIDEYEGDDDDDDDDDESEYDEYDEI